MKTLFGVLVAAMLVGCGGGVAPQTLQEAFEAECDRVCPEGVLCEYTDAGVICLYATPTPGPSKCVAPVVERIAEFHQSETAKASCDTNATEGYYCNQQAKTSGCEVSATSPAPFNAYPIGTDVSSCSGRQGVYPCCSLVLDPDNGAFDCLCAWCL